MYMYMMAHMRCEHSRPLSAAPGRLPTARAYGPKIATSNTRGVLERGPGTINKISNPFHLCFVQIEN